MHGIVQVNLSKKTLSKVFKGISQQVDSFLKSFFQLLELCSSILIALCICFILRNMNPAGAYRAKELTARFVSPSTGTSTLRTWPAPESGPGISVPFASPSPGAGTNRTVVLRRRTWTAPAAAAARLRISASCSPRSASCRYRYQGQTYKADLLSDSSAGERDDCFSVGGF
ncbi:hypothetical protein BDV06DRAFT_225165 [Aspergillus oleicola]